MIDFNLLDRAVGDALSTTGYDVWNTQAAQGTAFPYLVFQRISDTPQRRGIRGSSRLETYRYLVKAYCAGVSPYDANTMIGAAYTALVATTITVPNAQTVAVDPGSGFPIPDPDGQAMGMARYVELTLAIETE